MSIINSKLKTWLRRNNFYGEGRKGTRNPMRRCNGYVVRSGRRFRIRGDLVDVGEVHDTFDRWTNSTERTIHVSEFIKEFSK